MATLASVIRRHGIARTGKLGAGSRGLALRLSSMGDPRFSLKRALTIPRKVRQALVNTAVGIASGTPIIGGIIKGAIASNPKAFPNYTGPLLPPSALGPDTMMGLSPLPAGSGQKGSASNPYTPADYMKAYGHHKRRHMRVTNVHALKRSMRRVTGFAKLAKSVMTFTHSHKIKKRGRRR